MINEIMYNYIKTLTPEEFKQQIKNKTFAEKCITPEVKTKLVKVIS